MAGPSGATARLALPYPLPADSVDVPRDVLALATKLDGLPSLGPALVTGLPANPPDGAEIYLRTRTTDTGAAEDTLWHFRFVAAQPVSFRWEFIGGNPLIVTGPNNEALTAGAGWKYPTTRTRARCMWAGQYTGHYQAQMASTGAGSIGLGIDSGSGNATPTANNAMSASIPAAGLAAVAGIGIGGRAAGDYVELTFNPGSVTAPILSMRRLVVFPRFLTDIS
jgi:hypothetical protein